MTVSGIVRKLFRRSAVLLFGTSLFVSGYLVQSYAVNQHYVQHIEERLLHSNAATASFTGSDCGICDLAQIVPQTPTVTLAVQVSPASELADFKPALDSIRYSLPRNLGARAPPAAPVSL